MLFFICVFHIWLLFSVYVCEIPSACLRSLLACVLCCDSQEITHPPDPDPPLRSSPSAARLSLTPPQGSAERPQTTLPLSSLSLDPLAHWTVNVRAPPGVGAMGDRGSIAGLSCSTFTPFEGTDIRGLIRTPRRQRRSLGGLLSGCSGLLENEWTLIHDMIISFAILLTCLSNLVRYVLIIDLLLDTRCFLF